MKTPSDIIADNLSTKDAARIIEALETAGYHIVRKDSGNEPFEFGRKYESRRPR